MPTGVIIDALAVALGGICGGILNKLLTPAVKAKLNLVFGMCSMGMGVAAIAPMKYMPAVILALIAGTILGLVCHLEQHITAGGNWMQTFINHILPTTANRKITASEYNSLMTTAIVLFCASGTGIYGALTNGMTGDASILIAKAILDFFTAAIFAANAGYAVAVIAVPQFIIFYLLFILAHVIFPLTTASMITDFKACGGFLMLATGFRMVKLKMFPLADMLPAMVLVMPLSWLWANVILNFIG